MATKVHRRADQTLERIDVSCDGCGTVESDEAIIVHGGLLKMGWIRLWRPGAEHYEHYCPKCKVQEKTSGN